MPSIDRSGLPDFDGFAVRFSERYGVNPNIIRAIVKAESNWVHNTVSRKGAIGLMQLMPGTAILLKVDPYNPEQNMEGGVRYFSFLLNTFKDLDLALIAYNAGPGYAERYSRGKASLYGETRNTCVALRNTSPPNGKVPCLMHLRVIRPNRYSTRFGHKGEISVTWLNKQNMAAIFQSLAVSKRPVGQSKGLARGSPGLQ